MAGKTELGSMTYWEGGRPCWRVGAARYRASAQWGERDWTVRIKNLNPNLSPLFSFGLSIFLKNLRQAGNPLPPRVTNHRFSFFFFFQQTERKVCSRDRGAGWPWGWCIFYIVSFYVSFMGVQFPPSHLSFSHHLLHCLVPSPLASLHKSVFVIFLMSI